MSFTLWTVCCYLAVSLVCYCVSSENVARLPMIVTPHHYRLTLLPVLTGSTPRLCGHVWIDVTARMSTNIIMLHATDVTVVRAVVFPAPAANFSQLRQDLSVDTGMVEDYCFNSIVYQDADYGHNGDLADSVHHDGQKDLLTIILTDSVKQGARYHIGLLYSAKVYDNTDKGFFRTQYPGDGDDCCMKTMGATQLEAIHARRMFPCLDEPSYKASYQLLVGHDAKMTALTNMPLLHTDPMLAEEGWVWDTFDTSPLMSTYLVAVVLTEFQHVETSYETIDGRNVTLRLWTHQQRLKDLQFSVHMAPRLISGLEKYLDVPYTLPKLDIIAIPGYESGKAMENWGLIVHSESSLLMDDNFDFIDRSMVAVTMVHEFAHQWFGNLVTARWWDEIWLNEGLATLFENIILREVAPELETELVLIAFLEDVMKSDLLFESHSLSEAVEKFPSIDEKFDSVAYAKGAAIFRMVRNFVGEEAFKSAINRYLHTFQYANANSTEVWNLINQEARRMHTISGRMSVARIMKTWTQQPGYPLVYVHCAKNGIVHISQRPYKESEFPIDNATMAVSASWWVPISMTSSDAPDFSAQNRLPTVWLSPRKPYVELEGPKGPNAWVIVNLESSGYYRVNYDRRNWDVISQQLVRNHTVIPLLTRAQLIDDAFTLAHANIQPYDVPLQLVKYLGQTDDDTLLRKIVKGHVELMRANSDNLIDNPEKEGIIENILAIIYQRRRRGRGRLFAKEDLDEVLTASRCEAGESACVSEALRLFKASVNGSTTPDEEKAMRKHLDLVWCTALRHGDESSWLMTWKSSQKAFAKLPHRIKLLRAMACTTDANNVRKLLTRIFHPNFEQSPAETSAIFKGLASNKMARPLLVDFLLRNWDFLLKHFTNDSVKLSNLLFDAIKDSHSVEELDKVKLFLSAKQSQVKPSVAERILAVMRRNVGRMGKLRPNSSS